MAVRRGGGRRRAGRRRKPAAAAACSARRRGSPVSRSWWWAASCSRARAGDAYTHVAGLLFAGFGLLFGARLLHRLLP